MRGRMEYLARRLLSEFGIPMRITMEIASHARGSRLRILLSMPFQESSALANAHFSKQRACEDFRKVVELPFCGGLL